MLFEVDEDTRDFVTLYDRNYYPKPRTAVTNYIPVSSLETSSYFYKNAYDTVYRLDFSRRPGNPKQPKLRLPDNWVIPETVQGKSYRNPQEIMTPGSSGLLERIGRPLNNLDPNMKQRKILNIKTGDSEYLASICSTGERIGRDKMRLQKPSRTIKVDCSTILQKI